MKTVDQIQPNYGPVYAAALYPALCSTFHQHGYALAVHGSLARDFDLIAVPWVETVSAPDDVIAALLADGLAVRSIGPAERKPHGRLAYTITVGFGECACDLSFMPLAPPDASAGDNSEIGQ